MKKLHMKNVVIIAHNEKKSDLIAFLKERERWLKDRQFIATGKTAEAVEEAKLGLKIQHLSQGRYGGYLQITDMINNGEVDAVIFIQDHKVKEKYHDDIENLLEACNMQNIPLATNTTTAELLFLGLIRLEQANRQKML